MRAQSKTWLVIGAAIVGALAGEVMTVTIWDHPMSWAMLEAPDVVKFGVGLVVGLLAGHFWWPARSRWPKQDRIIGMLGPPLEATIEQRYAAQAALWRIHRGGKA